MPRLPEKTRITRSRCPHSGRARGSSKPHAGLAAGHTKNASTEPSIAAIPRCDRDEHLSFFGIGLDDHIGARPRAPGPRRRKVRPGTTTVREHPPRASFAMTVSRWVCSAEGHRIFSRPMRASDPRPVRPRRVSLLFPAVARSSASLRAGGQRWPAREIARPAAAPSSFSTAALARLRESPPEGSRAQAADS